MLLAQRRACKFKLPARARRSLAVPGPARAGPTGRAAVTVTVTRSPSRTGTVTRARTLCHSKFPHGMIRGCARRSQCIDAGPGDSACSSPGPPGRRSAAATRAHGLAARRRHELSLTRPLKDQSIGRDDHWHAIM